MVNMFEEVVELVEVDVVDVAVVGVVVDVAVVDVVIGSSGLCLIS